MEDGYMVRYLPAALLRDLNIVDTPGTNVILERQQRLTEEYVPRADMVLFTMSAGAAPLCNCSQVDSDASPWTCVIPGSIIVMLLPGQVGL